VKRKILCMVLFISLLASFIYLDEANAQSITFDESLIEESYPANNQGAADDEKVEINPLIRIKFKEKVELADASKITLSSDGHVYSFDSYNDIWVTYDGYTLKIDINSLHRSGVSPLRANTAYKLTIGKGALRLNEFYYPNTKEKIQNEEINLYFITGTHTAPSDSGLRPVKYTSSISPDYDDITNLNTTKLEEKGSIYIHFYSDEDFPRELYWNQWTANPKVLTDEDAVKYFKLYKVPSAYSKSIDSNRNYDSQFRYNEYRQSLPLNGIEEVPLESVEILGDSNGSKTIIKVTPKEELLPLNKYILKLTKRDILTDNYEKIINENIKLVTTGQEIWTAPLDEDDIEPQWEMGKVSPEEVIEVYKGAYKQYTIYGAPAYNQYIDTANAKPIILYVDKEVIINPHKSNPLSEISLFEGYKENDVSNSTRKIKWYQLEYYFENDIKKTKISLYPEGELKAGRYYELIIPSEVFTARNDKPLDGIILNFAVEGNGLLERGIYKFEITNKPNRPLLVTDFESDKDDFEFTITGYNFAEDIKQLRFVRESDGKTITIPKSYLTFHDVTKITGKISGSAKSEFARVTASGEYGIVKSSAGAYDIYIDFDRGSSAGLTTVTQRLVVKDRPKVISTIPYDGERYFDPELLYREFSDDEGGYYIIVEFEDIGGTLGLTDVLNHGIEVKSQIDGTNLVDRTKPLKLEKEGPVSGYRTNKSILYIPIVEKLKDGQTYEVLIPASTVVEYSDVTTGGNRGYKWTFDTNYLPKADRLYEGSVPEYYDEDYPIVIEGSMFNKNTVVRFRHSSGRTYYPYDVEIIDDNKLYIYLPIRPRLPVGLYDLIISNGDNYNTEMVYGVFSVVEEGDYVPNEEYRIKSESYLGTVKEIKKISIDVLELNPRRANSSLLEIDLDELMGTETWARNIEYPANWRDTLGTLILKSKWANIEIYNLRLKDDAEERYIILRTGRAEPALADSIKMKLIGYSIKSNLIEVSGENFEFSWLLIEIPYFESDGINLKMLRYDELTRQFVEVPAAVEFVDGKVIGYTDKPGIFIVVE